MIDELRLLVRLQEIDHSLMDLEAEKGDLPEQVGILERELAKLNEVIEASQSAKAMLHDQKLGHDADLEAARERLKKSQATIFTVKTTREYDALSSEIEQAKKTIVDAEKSLLEIQNGVSDHTKLITQTNAKLADVRSEYDEKMAEMKERIEASQDEELQLSHEREKITVRIAKPVFAHYERIRKIREGVGVSHLMEGACSYCFAKVPAQRQAEVRRMNDLILCEGCGCIMVAPGD